MKLFRFSSKSLVIAAAAGLGITMANEPTADAATITSDFTVTATVASACLISTTSPTFGTSYDALTVNAAAPLDTTAAGNVSVTCAVGRSFDVDLLGVGPMLGTDPGNLGQPLAYGLYSDAPGGTPWATQSGLGGGLGAPVDFPVHGQIPAAQAPNAGQFQDTVTAQVTF